VQRGLRSREDLDRSPGYQRPRSHTPNSSDLCQDQPSQLDEPPQPLTTRPCFKGTPSARQAVRPWPGSRSGRGQHPGSALNDRGNAAPWRPGWRGSLAVAGGAAWPPASRATTHRRGPLPAPLLPRTRRQPGHPPLRTPGDRLHYRPCRPPRAGHPVAAQRSQSRALPAVASFGWRYAQLLSVIFHGKNRHLSGGTG
jgi:hypothetical protein